MPGVFCRKVAATIKMNRIKSEALPILLHRQIRWKGLIGRKTIFETCLYKVKPFSRLFPLAAEWFYFIWFPLLILSAYLLQL